MLVGASLDKVGWVAGVGTAAFAYLQGFSQAIAASWKFPSYAQVSIDSSNKITVRYPYLRQQVTMDLTRLRVISRDFAGTDLNRVHVEDAHGTEACLGLSTEIPEEVQEELDRIASTLPRPPDRRRRRNPLR